MISKVVTGKTFYGVCRYVCMDQKRALILATEGVRNYDHTLMAKDFELQHSLRPSLTKAIFHGILSFYPGEKIDDKMMTEIAKEYLLEMNIINTQYAITKHIDKDHLHLHIIANLVNNNGEVIKDNWIGLKGKKVSQKLTSKYGLKEVVTKNLELTNLTALNEKEANKYIIYQAILEILPGCRNLHDLELKLVKKKIETVYKYIGQSGELQGISFAIGNFKFKGSEIDRKFSVGKLQKIIHQQQIKTVLNPSPGTSMSLSQKQDFEINKVQGQSRNIIDELIKPEFNNEELPFQLRVDKPLKKISRGRHM